ncbi:CHAT domain-containing protein [Leptolyngbya ectocarpi]|nr:CHAT domain-containing protein [Leptolyngbya ectocarpi]
MPTEAATVTPSAQIQTQDISPTADQTSLLEQGRRYYQSGRFSDAINLWQQAAQTYETQENPTNQALSLSYLASAYKELGQWQAAETAISQSLELLQGTNPDTDTQISSNAALILAQAWNTQGSLQLAMGNSEAALSSWQQAEALYDETDDIQGKLGSQLNQAQALQSLGLHRQARTRLEEINKQLQSQPDSLLKAKALQSLGGTLQRVGAFSESLDVLEQSLVMTQQLDNAPDISAVLLGLGHTWQGLSENSKALDTYGRAAAKATSAIAQIEAHLSQLSLLIETDQIADAQTLLPEIRALLPDLPASRSAIYARVNFAQSLLKLVPQNTSANYGPEMVQLLSTAIQQAQELNDVRAESYGLGQLGQIYEQTGQWSDAQDLTEKALAMLQGLNAPEIAYQWQWQLGRIFCRGDIACTEVDRQGDAIAAYTDAVTQLGRLRTDLVANSQMQFSFREQVEPVYRELVTLLLTPSVSQAEISQENLKQAREVVESLQLAELDNFFQSACLDAQPQEIDQIDIAAAVLYPIVLPDRLAVILSVKGQPLQYYETRLPEETIQSSLGEMRQSLSLAYPNQLRLKISQQLYDWLIRPAEIYLTEDIKTLVFVPDGLLRSFPIAALHDGNQYLIEKYSVAISSGLQLLETQSLNPDQFKLLLGGLTESRQGFSALPAASFEVEQIIAQVPVKLFLNQDFTQANLQTQIPQVASSIVHLITHGQFSSSQEDTFILAWDKKVKMEDLSKILQTRQLSATAPIELLVLSACQTAAGDNRAGLGLAGFALRSGARSTLASLWSVDDQSTAELMVKFYNTLSQSQTTKAEALRQAQLALLRQEGYRHPFFWAAFVMVGNWL